jgi:hypothetical protein
LPCSAAAQPRWVSRHVGVAEDAGDDALVPVTAGHLVAHGQLAFHGDVDLDHLDHARRQLVSFLKLGDFLVAQLLQDVDPLDRALFDPPDLVELGRSRGLDPPEVLRVDAGHGLRSKHRALVQDLLVPAGTDELLVQRLALEQPHQGLAVLLADDADLVVHVLADPLDLFVLDLEGAEVLLDPLAAEDLDVDDGAADSRRSRQGGVAHVTGLLAEDRPEQFLLRRQLGLALGRDLADEDVAGLDRSPDPDHARFVQVLQEFLGDVGDVAGDLLGPQLRVPGLDFELLDVDRRVRVVLDQRLGHEDRILEVVAPPGHEGDEDVPAQGQLAPLGAGAVGQNLPRLDALAFVHDRALVDAGVLVRPLELGQGVDVRPEVLAPLGADPDDDAPRIHEIHDAVALAGHDGTRVACGDPFHPRADQGCPGSDQRHRLALHVRAHERPVRVVVLQEGDQRGRHRHELFRGNIDVADLLSRDKLELAGFAGADALVLEPTVVGQQGVGLGDDGPVLFPGGQVERVRHR